MPRAGTQKQDNKPAKMGRPVKNYDKKAFVDLIGIGCGADEICWFFRDESGKPVNIDTLSRWCVREFGCTFQEYRRQNGAMFLKIQLRKNQIALSKTSAAMAIFLGKNYLGQTDEPAAPQEANELMQSLFDLERRSADD
jgi:hypothetical protein